MIGVSEHQPKRRRCLSFSFLGLCLILFADPALSAEFTVDLLPGQSFTTQAGAEAAMRATSPQASHLVYDRLLSETATEKVHLYSVPSVPATIATQNIYGGPYYLPVWQWGTTYHDSVEGAIGDWWSRYQSYYYWAFPGCTYTPFYYDGRYTNHFATVQLSGRCGGGGGVYGTLVTRAGSLQCPPDYTLSGNQCIISLTAIMIERDTCPVPALSKLEDLNAQLSSNDPDTMPLESSPINTARLTTATREAYQCLKEEIDGFSIPTNLASAFRTEAYQRHLWEIYDRWITQGLNEDDSSTCAARKAEVFAKWRHHGLEGLKTSPAYSAGKHLRGPAFDISRKTTIRQLEAKGVDIKAMVGKCGLKYPLPVKDKGHFELQ